MSEYAEPIPEPGKVYPGLLSQFGFDCFIFFKYLQKIF